MSKAFSFGFATDDIDEDDALDDECVVPGIDRVQIDKDIVLPQVHLLQDLLSTFPSHLSFSTTSISGDGGIGIEVPRRDLFDIRTQLMAEDGTLSGDSVGGLSADDIVPNVYEGGFKTWECSMDLSSYICSNIDVCGGSSVKDTTIIELGAGTALPSISLLGKWLSQRLWYSEAAPSLQICLADYNRSVLELATIPNLYLVTQLFNQSISGNEIDSRPENLKQFQTNLSDSGIDVSAISGSWTPEFADLIPPITRSSHNEPHETVILASETIYSPKSIRMFTQVLLSTLRKVKSQGSNGKAFVAAKRVYFGVGGGTDEFLEVLEDLGGRGSIVWETQGAGVGRVIIAVALNPL